MFRGCGAFNNGDTSNASSKPLVWTLTALQDAFNMFAGCSVFNQPLIFSDTGAVTTFQNTLGGCLAFKQDISAWTVTACTNFSGFFVGDLNNPNSATNQTNYDALLVAWAAQALQNGVTLDMGTSQYSVAAAAAHLTLTTTFAWTVNDGGQA